MSSSGNIPSPTPHNPSTGGVFGLITNDGKKDKMILMQRTRSEVERDFHELGLKLGRTEDYTNSIIDMLFAQPEESDTDSTDSTDSTEDEI